MNSKIKSVIFFGTPFFAREILDHLLNSQIPISLVVTQPSKPSGRKKEKKDSEVKEFALKNKLEILECDKIGSQQIEIFKRKSPDFLITAAFGSLLPKELLELPKYGSLNVHPSLLPKYRGPSPIQYALLNGDKNTGTTIMLMNEKMDAGEVLSQQKLSVNDKDNYLSLEKKLADASKELLTKTMLGIVEKKLVGQKQDETKASFSKIIKKEYGLVDWNTPAQEIMNKHRAYFQWPKIFSFFFDNGARKKIIFHEIELLDSSNNFEPGKVVLHENKVLIGTKKGAISVKNLQLEGKSPMPANQFVLGKKNFIGSVLNNC